MTNEILISGRSSIIDDDNPQMIKLYKYGVYVQNFDVRFEFYFLKYQFLSQLKSLLEIKLDLESGDNHVSRNSHCTFGGDNLTIFVTNPRDEFNFVIGIKITLIPNVPDQDLGKTQYFTKVEYYENFDPTKSGISVTYPVVPEYSYLVSVAFNTEESCNK